VWLAPGDPVWLDLWIPSDDALWTSDVIEASRWVGERWAAVLDRLGVPDLAVHGGPSVPGARALACFGALGPGELSVGGRKLVGVAQWRCRQGALFHCALYHRWDPTALVDVLSLTSAERAGLSAHLVGFAAGLDDVVTAASAARLDGPALWQLLLPEPERWEIRPA
jgi:hypothetical protein